MKIRFLDAVFSTFMVSLVGYFVVAQSWTYLFLAPIVAGVGIVVSNTVRSHVRKPRLPTIKFPKPPTHGGIWWLLAPFVYIVGLILTGLASVLTVSLISHALGAVFTSCEEAILCGMMNDPFMNIEGFWGGVLWFFEPILLGIPLLVLNIPALFIFLTVHLWWTNFR